MRRIFWSEAKITGFFFRQSGGVAARSAARIEVLRLKQFANLTLNGHRRRHARFFVFRPHHRRRFAAYGGDARRRRLSRAELCNLFELSTAKRRIAQHERQRAQADDRHNDCNPKMRGEQRGQREAAGEDAARRAAAIRRCGAIDEARRYRRLASAQIKVCNLNFDLAERRIARQRQFGLCRVLKIVCELFAIICDCLR